jgi:hypothetical protein
VGVAARGQTIILPTETAKDYFEMYAEQGPAVLVLTVRSAGGLKASVDSHDLRLVPIGDRLMGINDFPSINPPLPCPVDIGDSQRWLYERRNVAGSPRPSCRHTRKPRSHIRHRAAATPVSRWPAAPRQILTPAITPR